jgi:hypothetical protein
MIFFSLEESGCLLCWEFVVELEEDKSTRAWRMYFVVHRYLVLSMAHAVAGSGLYSGGLTQERTTNRIRYVFQILIKQWDDKSN